MLYFFVRNVLGKGLKEEVEIAEEKEIMVYVGVEGWSEDIYGSKKYNRIARPLWQTTGDEEPIIAGERESEQVR